MKYLNLCISSTLEKLCMKQCGQHGAFGIVSTTNPGSTPSRLNGGWSYYTGPRRGTRTPPLAYCNDWKVVFTWHIAADADVESFLRAIRKMFDRPCVIAQIETQLMEGDNRAYPGLKAKGMSKNGLDNVFCLKRGSLATREETSCESDDDYRILINETIVERVQAVIDETGIEEIEQAQEEGGDDVTQN